MRENGLMKFVTVAAIVAVLYLFLKYRQAGTAAQVQPNTIPTPSPGTLNECNITMATSNCAIPISTDYLCACTVQLHSPAASSLVARAAKIPSIMPQPVGVMQNSSNPYGVKQSCCVPGISAAQAQKIFPPAKKVTVLSGANGFCCIRGDGGCSTIGGCGPNLRCLRSSGICCLAISTLSNNCIDV